MTPAPRLPDFIIIGAMKSATSTLHDQLSRQPGIFMSEPKEPNFFSDDAQYERGLPWYAGLFACAPADALCGESSTHYTKLPTHPCTVERMRSALHRPRLVYVMRHPIDRLVSHYIHEWTMGTMDCSIDEAVGRYPELVSFSRYSMQLTPYFDAFGQGSVLPVFFDRLTNEPQSELARVCDFIGYAGTPVWHADAGPMNVSSERIRRFPLYDLVVESSVAQALRRTLVPGRVRQWVRSRLTMRQRPTLSGPNIAKLEACFDEDLRRLGAWLGTDLTCRNFKEATAGQELDWTPRAAIRAPSA